MKKHFAIVILLFSIVIETLAQGNSTAVKYLQYIDPSDLNIHLSIFASDEFEGRETGKKGQKMAAEYLKNEFQKLGLVNVSDEGPYQTYKLHKKVLGKRLLEINQTEFKIADDFFQQAIGLFAQGGYFLDGLDFRHLLQPAHLDDDAVTYKAIFAENLAQRYGLAAVAAVDRGYGGQ